MTKVVYKINVAFEGQHDFTVTVDRNGPYNTTQQHAKFVLRALRKSFDDSRYEATMQEVSTTTTAREI